MSEPSRQVPVRFQVEVPPDVEAGVPAEFANVWHTRTSFVLDFAVPKGPPQVLDDEAGGVTMLASGKLTASPAASAP